MNPELNEAVLDEVRRILQESEAPLDRTGVYRLCGEALDVGEVSQALHALVRAGEAAPVERLGVHTLYRAAQADRPPTEQAPAPAAGITRTALCRRIVKLLGEGPATTQQLRAQLDNTPIKPVSNALYRLKTQGEIEQDESRGPWRLTQTRPATARGQEPAAKPPHEGSSRQPKQRHRDSVLQLLERSAGDTRDALRRYIDELNDPVLEQLLASAGTAADALTAYRRRNAR
ncbi:hypothetical protein [Alkalilimnicola sp. S0819]|uniref:hypothetical protein n=1 Tax=Alkalilimnicola sp. S0819 TaxID=2613922 RepID=UPI0012626AE1|nr:hypothetical protein [Alkalilimnicola sp. S0819]KAB7624348.1 hypothetical protein F3N43_05950 [Alkalilimnicola sp. S0819]MPQ16174.1 hypothetical protein [Alkalilimnicola sp. S0819]